MRQNKRAERSFECRNTAFHPSDKTVLASKGTVLLPKEFLQTGLESRSRASLRGYVLRLKNWYKARPSARDGRAIAVAGTFSKTAA